MDSKLLKAACEQIYRQFPEMKGTKPSVSSYSATQYLLIFKTNSKTSDGHNISRSVRVVVNQDGIISKVTTSR
jgi:hypothetical protein